MSIYLEDAERFLSEAESKLSSAINDRVFAENCFKKSPVGDNKQWVDTSREKETIMYAVCDELQGLVNVTRKEKEMMDNCKD